MNTYRSRCAVVLAALALLTACTADKQETPPTTTPAESTVSRTTTPSTATGTRTTAPPVTQPLTAGDFGLDPCATLTPTQREALAITDAEFTDLAREGAGCDFRRGPDDRATVVFATRVGLGLDRVYAQNSSMTWDYWEPTTIDGYPAVGYNAIVDNETTLCNFAIGISDSLYFWVTAAAENDNDRCRTARQVASAILATVKAVN
jgi:hypothetical protein